jgi:UDP-N-acetylenolpyruvoylglucosamine reductase
MAGQRLVDGVVDDLVDHVVQAGAVIGVADIHARPLAHGLQALENLDGIGAVLGIFALRFFSHEASPSIL